MANAPKKKPATTRPKKAATSKTRTNAKASPTNKNWVTTAVIGGLGAAGAIAGAAFIAMRGAAKADEAPRGELGHAHQVDGTDSTAEFRAGIADEGMIPGA